MLFAEFDEWMRDRVLPLWSGVGRDANGAFYESLTLDGAPDVDAVRRVRVQFRQIYVYACAYTLGIAPDGLQIARTAFDRVREDAWAPDGAPGWTHLQNPDRTVLDASRDAYDQAFSLLAMAWLYRAQPDPEIRKAIDQTVAFLDTGFAARSGGWWERADTEIDLRRQNPHMHALEAMMALYEATGERDFLDRAREIYHLFAARFYSWSDHVVIEYFDLDWRPAAPAYQRLEPGHMAEWVYLLREYERLAGENVDALANPLFERALELGVTQDPSGRFLMDELDLSGALTKQTRRLWPQTERIKATLAQYRANGGQALRSAAEQALEELRDEYLSNVVPGGWRDAFSKDGAFVAQDIPASTLYHLFSMYVLVRDLLSRRPRKPLNNGASEETSSMAADATKNDCPKIVPALLAGGKGSRLWPLSTSNTPKQFQPLMGERTLLQETLKRVADPSVFAPPVIICGREHEGFVLDQGGESSRTIVIEPAGRNSAPAAGVAAEIVVAEDPHALVLIIPSDQMIRETALFRQLVAGASTAAREGYIVTFGITPTRPETGYGYIRAGEPLGRGGAFTVDAFIEKPDLPSARAYAASGSYLWNSGMFLFRAADFLEEMQTHQPQMREAVSNAVAKAARDGDIIRLDEAAFAASPSDSIDYAIMEKTERAAVCPAALTWSDIGSWDALADAQVSDEDGNTAIGEVAMLDCQNVYARTDQTRIAAVGVQDLVVVSVGDTLLISHRGATQRVKEVAELINGDHED
ncbi:MAG: mannose-1-phosphate guanylyltransferase/mannose-6-phosphate isomerase [Pseudomonadota bacterium]